jgi:hypothetical protein
MAPPGLEGPGLRAAAKRVGLDGLGLEGPPPNVSGLRFLPTPSKQCCTKSSSPRREDVFFFAGQLAESAAGRPAIFLVRSPT